jgi:hypothetical protein
METKICTCCKQEKPLAAFSKKRRDVVPCCGLCNSIKSDHLTYAEMMGLSPKLRIIHGNRKVQGFTCLWLYDWPCFQLQPLP